MRGAPRIKVQWYSHVRSRLKPSSVNRIFFLLTLSLIGSVMNFAIYVTCSKDSPLYARPMLNNLCGAPRGERELKEEAMAMRCLGLPTITPVGQSTRRWNRHGLWKRTIWAILGEREVVGACNWVDGDVLAAADVPMMMATLKATLQSHAREPMQRHPVSLNVVLGKRILIIIHQWVLMFIYPLQNIDSRGQRKK